VATAVPFEGGENVVLGGIASWCGDNSGLDGMVFEVRGTTNWRARSLNLIAQTEATWVTFAAAGVSILVDKIPPSIFRFRSFFMFAILLVIDSLSTASPMLFLYQKTQLTTHSMLGGTLLNVITYQSISLIFGLWFPNVLCSSSFMNAIRTSSEDITILKKAKRSERLNSVGVFFHFFSSFLGSVSLGQSHPVQATAAVEA
jgi:hypothetical protein